MAELFRRLYITISKKKKKDKEKNDSYYKIRTFLPYYFWVNQVVYSFLFFWKYAFVVWTFEFTERAMLESKSNDTVLILFGIDSVEIYGIFKSIKPCDCIKTRSWIHFTIWVNLHCLSDLDYTISTGSLPRMKFLYRLV